MASIAESVKRFSTVVVLMLVVVIAGHGENEDVLVNQESAKQDVFQPDCELAYSTCIVQCSCSPFVLQCRTSGALTTCRQGCRC